MVLAGVALVGRRASQRAASVAESVALVAGGLTLVFGALGWGDGPLGAPPCSCSWPSSSPPSGGVFAAMILGHWYLVTPKLPEAPLILLARVLLVVVAVQVGLFVAWVATGAGPADASALRVR